MLSCHYFTKNEIMKWTSNNYTLNYFVLIDRKLPYDNMPHVLWNRDRWDVAWKHFYPAINQEKRSSPAVCHGATRSSIWSYLNGNRMSAACWKGWADWKTKAGKHPCLVRTEPEDIGFLLVWRLWLSRESSCLNNQRVVSSTPFPSYHMLMCHWARL